MGSTVLDHSLMDSTVGTREDCLVNRWTQVRILALLAFHKMKITFNVHVSFEVHPDEMSENSLQIAPEEAWWSQSFADQMTCTLVSMLRSAS